MLNDKVEFGSGKRGNVVYHMKSSLPHPPMLFALSQQFGDVTSQRQTTNRITLSHSNMLPYNVIQDIMHCMSIWQAINMPVLAQTCATCGLVLAVYWLGITGHAMN